MPTDTKIYPPAPPAPAEESKGLSSTVIIAACVVVVSYGAACAFIAIFAQSMASVVIPLMLASMGLVIPSLLSLVRAGEAKTEARNTHRAVNSRMEEMIEMTKTLAGLEATIAEKVAQAAREAIIAAATETNTTSTTTITSSSPATYPPPTPPVAE